MVFSSHSATGKMMVLVFGCSNQENGSFPATSVSAPAEPTRTPSPAPAEPTHTPSPAPAEPTHTPSPAPAEPTHTPSPAPAEPTHTPSPAPAEPTRTPSPAPAEPTHTPSPAPVEPTHTPSPTPAATIVASDLDVQIAADTSWKDIFVSLADENQSCIRDRFGDNLESILAQRLLSDERETLIFECLGQGMSRDIYLAYSVKYLENLELCQGEMRTISTPSRGGAGWVVPTETGGERTLPQEVEGCASRLGFDLGGSGKLNEAEISCLRERATSLDVAALSADDAASDTEIFAGIISCAPDFLISVLTGGLDLQLGDLTRQETSCLRRFLTGLDEEALADLDDGRTPEVISGLSSCIPDVLISSLIDGVGIAVEDLSREEHSCLREWIANVDWSNDLDVDELASRMFACIPDVLISPFVDGFGITMEDLSREEHSCLRERIATLDWSNDLDEEEQAFGLVACVPDILISLVITEFGITMEDLSQEEQSCLRETIRNIDWSNDLTDSEINAGILACTQSSGGTVNIEGQH